MPVPPERLLAQFENASLLHEPDSLALRLDMLDQLDLLFPQAYPGPGSAFASRVQTLRLRLEAANQQLYQSIRREILQGTCPALFTRELNAPDTRPTGNHYDHLDELLAGVFAIPEPVVTPAAVRVIDDAEQVFYQPTPARHIFELIRQAHLTAADTLVDLGSGLGHVSLLVSACTGASTIGIELEPAYVASARYTAEALHLEKVSFQAQDARSANLSSGTVFYLYTPFTGSILSTVLDNLKAEANLRAKSATHAFRIATFGPCTITVAQEEWLTPATPPAEDRITIFHPTKQTMSS